MYNTAFVVQHKLQYLHIKHDELKSFKRVNGIILTTFKKQVSNIG